MIRIFLLVIVIGSWTLASWVSAEDTDQVAIVGVDASGNSVEHMLDRKAFVGSMQKAVTTVQDSTQVALARQSLNPNSCWTLQTVGVGIAVTGIFGLGPVFSLSAGPHLRLLFTNSKNPVYPD